MNIPASGGCAILNRDVFLHTISTFLLARLGEPAQPMLPILPILPKKVMLFAKMLSNSIKNAREAHFFVHSPNIRKPPRRQGCARMHHARWRTKFLRSGREKAFST
jgi:hypothetical protein